MTRITLLLAMNLLGAGGASATDMIVVEVPRSAKELRGSADFIAAVTVEKVTEKQAHVLVRANWKGPRETRLSLTLDPNCGTSQFAAGWDYLVFGRRIRGNWLLLQCGSRLLGDWRDHTLEMLGRPKWHDEYWERPAQPTTIVDHRCASGEAPLDIVLEDPTGARLNAVEVHVSSTRRGDRLTTDDSAVAHACVVEGPVRISGQMPGFKAFKRTVSVKAGRHYRESVVVQLAAISCGVNVISEPSRFRGDTAERKPK